MKDRRLRITLDTNTLPLERALLALGGIQADVVITTVTAREIHHEIPNVTVTTEFLRALGS